MLSISVLPASYGDAIWIEYGDPQSPAVILIDAGPSVPDALQKKLLALKARGGEIEVAVVTHIDADHIAGMLTLLKNDFGGVPVKDFWFNGFRHLPTSKEEEFGPKQGEQLTTLLEDKKHSIPWNKAFNKRRIAVNDNPHFAPVVLQGGARITLLSPNHEKLFALRKVWIQECEKAGLHLDFTVVTQELKPGEEVFGEGTPDVDKLADLKFSEDAAAANGSSIAFIFEYEGKKILFGADAYPSLLVESIKACFPDGSPKFAAVKLPHHGSENNVSTALIQSLQSDVFIFSSNGKRFGHPSAAAVARVIKYAPNCKLAFNYRSKFNEQWDNAILALQWNYTIDFGNDDGYELHL